ncbi:6080_t:CDS:10, partial [Acaulospora morrowiae]
GRYDSMSDTFQIYKLACEKALRRSTKSSNILRDAYEGFSKIPDIWALMVVRGNKQRTQYLSTVEAMESMVDINYYNLILEKLITDANTFYTFQVSLKFVSPTEENPVFSNKKKIGKRLNDLIQDETSRSLLLYELRSLFESFNASNIEWNDPLSFADFQGNDEEFEDICVMHRIIDSIRHIWCYFNDENKADEGTYIVRIVSNFLDSLFCYENSKLKIIWAEEVSEASQRRMDDSGEIRIGHKPDFRVKSPLIAGEVEICLMEASRVLPTDKKIRDDWDKSIKLMKDAHVRLLRKLTRGRVGDVKEIEEDLNRVPVFGIQVAGGTMACWVMTMPFGAFYFVQRLGSVQIPMNRGQSSLAGFMDELWKLRASLRNHIRTLNEIVEKVDASLYNIAFCSPQAREDVPLYDGEQSLRTSLTIAIAKSAKRNRRKKLTRYAYKVLANQGKEATIIPSNDKDIQNNEAPTVNPNIHDNTDNQKKHEKTEIFYNPEKHKTQIETRKSTKKDTVNYIRTQWVSENFVAEDLKSTNLSQPSTVVSPKSTFIEKFLEKRRERRIANQIPIDDISSIPEKYMKLLEVEIFREPNVLESIPQDLWNGFGQWACFINK